jgi:hypothetical protein
MILIVMIDEAAAYRIYPPRGAGVRWALKLFLWVVGIREQGSW